MVSAVTSHRSLCSDLAHDCPNWRSWGDTPTLFLHLRRLTTLSHPPPTYIAESQSGEPRSEAFGTDARVAMRKYSSAALDSDCLQVCFRYTKFSDSTLHKGIFVF